MKAHLQNKDSEILWVENIPAHWDMWKVKFVSFYQNGAAFKSDLFRNDGDVFVIRIGDLVGSKVSLEDATTLTKENAEGFENVRLKKNDILLALTGATIGKSALFELEEECYLNQRVALFRPRKNISKEFLMLFIDSDIFRTHIDFECYGGAQENVGKSQILNAKLPLPPLPEQRQIAAYLDYKTNQIDRFIANRKKQIELLEEQEEAIINKAVTKGIDPKVKLKPSGVDWIGDIPEHWEVWKVRYLSKNVLTGTTPPSNELKYYDGGTINWFAPGDFGYDFELNNSTRKITALAIQDNVCKLYKKDSVLVIGIGATLGKVRFCKNPCSSNQQINSIEFDKKVIQPKYGFYFLHSFEDVIISRSNASTMGILNQTKTKEIEIAFPRSIDDQNEIIEHIENELSERNELISKYQKQIDLMQEYKTALISKAVTGKIDVREWQPKQTLKETV